MAFFLPIYDDGPGQVGYVPLNANGRLNITDEFEVPHEVFNTPDVSASLGGGLLVLGVLEEPYRVPYIGDPDPGGGGGIIGVPPAVLISIFIGVTPGEAGQGSVR